MDQSPFLVNILFLSHFYGPFPKVAKLKGGLPCPGLVTTTPATHLPRSLEDGAGRDGFDENPGELAQEKGPGEGTEMGKN